MDPVGKIRRSILSHVSQNISNCHITISNSYVEMVDAHLPHVYCTLATHYNPELPVVIDCTLLPPCNVERKQCDKCELAVPVHEFRAQRRVCRRCTNEQSRLRMSQQRSQVSGGELNPERG